MFSFFWITLNTLEGQAIQVFAGNDTLICAQATLHLSDLKPTITGLVNDGNWFTRGDGYFLPNQTNNHLFSTATYYVPGNLDAANGYVILDLVSDDPDGIGILTQESDEVHVQLSSNVAMICNNNISVSLNPMCQQELHPNLLLSGSLQESHLYDIEAFDEAGNLIEDAILNHRHVGQQIDFNVKYTCSGNSCWGSLSVSDKLPPIFNCTNHELSCFEDISPDAIGYPFPLNSSIDTIIGNAIFVNDFDACSQTTVQYLDTELEFPCESDTAQLVTRYWTGVDASGNSSSCTQEIALLRSTLADIQFPVDYKAINGNALECSGEWPSLSNGHPHPDSTGYPDLGFCDNMDTYYSDVYFQNCGNTFKILRTWTVHDWCKSEQVDKIQTIEIKDSIAPSITCPVDMTIGVSTFVCQSSPTDIAWNHINDGCGDVMVDFDLYANGIIVHSIVDITGSNALLPALELGQYEAVISAKDACSNTSMCSFFITIVDDQVPFMACDEITTVSLGADGTGRIYANSLDDGSLDTCSPLSFLVRKMTDGCGYDQSYADYVQFCCNEIGQTLMVELMAQDAYGNMNSCMVEVIIEDDVAPLLSCPPDLTIDCTSVVDTSDWSIFGKVVPSNTVVSDIVIYDAYNAGVVGQDGIYSDNCSSTISEEVLENLDCGIGTITRIFKAIDMFGAEQTCTQTITVQNAQPFSEDNITWLDDVEFTGCAFDIVDQNLMGRPSYTTNHCDDIAITYDDQVLTTVENACYGVLREWTIIDWCQYDTNTQLGIWSDIQEIRQYNNIAPSWNSCADTMLCIIENCDVLYTKSMYATDDCSGEGSLEYSWALDINSDGSIDESGESNSISQSLEIGIHKVTWTVEDGCGNYTTCQEIIEVKDCKAPQPTCRTSFTIVISESTGEAEIWAEDFYLYAEDNCDDEAELEISFSPSIDDNVRIFSCHDITNGVERVFDLEMWVTDSSGNADFCAVQLIVQDNHGDACLDVIQQEEMHGWLRSYSSYYPEGSYIELQSEGMTDTLYTMDEYGAYDLSLMTDLDYLITPRNKDNYTQGVSVLDILLIQKHILGIQPFDEAYKVLAADVNSSNSVSSLDLIELQKLILGQTDTLRRSDSWLFVPEEYEYPESSSPWGAPFSINYGPSFPAVDSLNFRAIKVGDVNGSINLQSDQDLSTRNSGYTLHLEKDNLDNDLWHVYGADHLEAIQFAVQLPDDYSEISTEYGNQHYHIDENHILRFIYSDPSSQRLTKAKPLFSFRSSSDVAKLISIENDAFDSFVLKADQSIENIDKVEYYNEPTQGIDDELVRYNVYPNPSRGDVHITVENPERESIELSIYDSAGHQVYTFLCTETETISLGRSYFKNTGLYILRGSSSRSDFIQKIIIH